MKFRTEIQLKKERNQIDYDANLALFGSCFSENIFNKLDYFKFNVLGNPFGILFNPIAIEKIITKSINSEFYDENDVFQLNERWHCFDAHSDLSANSKEALISNLNIAVEKTKTTLKKSSHIVITLGTAWTYRFIETNSRVGNCHKVPQKKFLKEMLSTAEVKASLENIIALVKDINPNVSFIFTVSPVRHLKDGFIENTQSKAHLITAIQQIINAKESLYYFPSYEIMLDDLRDYRFYEEDMVHPNKTAIDYIWRHFKTVWINESSSLIMKEVDAIQKGLSHKPFNPNSQQHKAFKKKLSEKISALRKNHNIEF